MTKSTNDICTKPQPSLVGYTFPVFFMGIAMTNLAVRRSRPISFSDGTPTISLFHIKFCGFKLNVLYLLIKRYQH